MIGPVCPVCGGQFGSCACNGQGKPKLAVVERLQQRAPEVRHWLDVVCLGLALIVAGVVTLLV